MYRESNDMWFLRNVYHFRVGRDATIHDSIEIEVQKESFSPADSGIHVNSECNDNFSGDSSSIISFFFESFSADDSLCFIMSEICFN